MDRTNERVRNETRNVEVIDRKDSTCGKNKIFDGPPQFLMPELTYLQTLALSSIPVYGAIWRSTEKYFLLPKLKKLRR